MKFWVLMFMPMFWTACLPNCLSFHNLRRQLYLYAYVNIVKVYLTVICFNLLLALLLCLSVQRLGAWWHKVIFGGNGDHGSRNRLFYYDHLQSRNFHDGAEITANRLKGSDGIWPFIIQRSRPWSSFSLSCINVTTGQFLRNCDCSSGCGVPALTCNKVIYMIVSELKRSWGGKRV